MAPNPSIESYFKPIAASPLTSSSDIQEGDGFTAEELSTASFTSLNSGWSPSQEYAEVDIGALEGGPRPIFFQGRIVNFRNYKSSKPSKYPGTSSGYWSLVLKDDSGAICVRLHYSRVQYPVQLGKLTSVWTTHISHGDGSAYSTMIASLFTSINPEHDKRCHIMFQDNSDMGVLCKLPLGYKNSHEVDHSPGVGTPELMTLKAFVNGGHDVTNLRLLLCVKGVGVRKKVSGKKFGPTDVVKVMLFDDTAEADLTLWGEMTLSATTWIASKTVLMITNPGWNLGGKRVSLSVNGNTMFDIDPAIDDVEWVRGFASRLTKKQHINPPFSYNSFDFEAFHKDSVKVLFSFADLDEHVRLLPYETTLGYLCVVIMELNLVKYYQRQMLFSNECCGLPAHANATVSKCSHCESDILLRVNPRVLGMLVDETGCTSPGRLILSEEGWTTLLGKSADGLVSLNSDELSDIEQSLLFSRVVMLFGWAAEDSENGVGRICVAEVNSYS